MTDVVIGWVWIGIAAITASDPAGGLVAGGLARRRSPAAIGRHERRRERTDSTPSERVDCWQRLAIAGMQLVAGIWFVTGAWDRYHDVRWIYLAISATILVWMLRTDAVPWLRARLRSGSDGQAGP